jgi:hypothetical protein
MYIHTNIQSTLMKYVTMCVVLQQRLLNGCWIVYIWFIVFCTFVYICKKQYEELRVNCSENNCNVFPQADNSIWSVNSTWKKVFFYSNTKCITKHNESYIDNPAATAFSNMCCNPDINLVQIKFLVKVCYIPKCSHPLNHLPQRQ